MPGRPTFYLHEEADRDLESIFDHSVENFGFARAELYVYEIEQVFYRLAENPSLGTRYDPDVKKYFRYLVGSHWIFYAPGKNGLDIYRILHQSMLPDLHL